MKEAKQIRLLAALAFGLGLTLSSMASCDTPKSIAWSYYYCAKDTLEAGDPFAAKHFLKSCKKTADPSLASKVDSLAEVIEREIQTKKIKE